MQVSSLFPLQRRVKLSVEARVFEDPHSLVRRVQLIRVRSKSDSSWHLSTSLKREVCRCCSVHNRSSVIASNVYTGSWCA